MDTRTGEIVMVMKGESVGCSESASFAAGLPGPNFVEVPRDLLKRLLRLSPQERLKLWRQEEAARAAQAYQADPWALNRHQRRVQQRRERLKLRRRAAA